MGGPIQVKFVGALLFLASFESLRIEQTQFSLFGLLMR